MNKRLVSQAILVGSLIFAGANVFAAANDFILDVTASTYLEKLDQPGLYSFATHLGAASQEQQFVNQNSGAPTFDRLPLMRLGAFTPATAGPTAAAWFSKISSSITNDVNEFVTSSGVHPTYSVTTLTAANKEQPRNFDPYWLSSKSAAFKLVAVINRIDRMDFDPNSCGELRFIYRLGYDMHDDKAVQDHYSVLPVFLNFVFKYKNPGSCQALAAQWKLSTAGLADQDYVNILMRGPLNKANLTFQQIELNMQIARFSSGDKTDFGGSAVYLFRIFAPSADGSQLVEKYLENTPDVAAILKNPALKKDLLAQMSDPKNLAAIDRGTFQLTNTNGTLLAKKALSFSTTGHGRLGNKPFAFLFLTQAGADQRGHLSTADQQALSGIQFTETDLIKSTTGLIERMDSLSCMGCHQSNSTAGFHILGRFFGLDTRTNRVALAFSPHYAAERVRRGSYMDALATGQAPDAFRPLPTFPVADWTQRQSPRSSIPVFTPAIAKNICLVAGSDLSVGLPCQDPRTECLVNAANSRLGVQYGECVFKKSLSVDAYAGLSCRAGVIENALSPAQAAASNLPFNFFSFKDKFIGLDKGPMPSEIYTLPADRRCGRPFGGIPLGRIAEGCVSDSRDGRLEFVDAFLNDKTKKNRELSLPDQICSVRGGDQFDQCAQTDHVIECLAGSPIRRTMIDLCYEGKYCREDYLCQQIPIEIISQYEDPAVAAQVQARITELNRRNVGFCVPNYFVFNMRIDGHPLPEGRLAGH